jgi:hypothetical protein
LFIHSAAPHTVAAPQGAAQALQASQHAEVGRGPPPPTSATP